MKIALILARGGSKSIPNKNIIKIKGKPLIWYMLEALIVSNQFDEIYVSTDSYKIESVTRQLSEDIKIFNRSKNNATDESTSEDAVLEFLNQNKFPKNTTLVLAQLTSPLTKPEDVKNAISHYEQNGADSLVTVARQKRFIWSKEGKPLNYDIYNRPRRQEFDGYLVENGALYITKVENFISTRNRLSGKIAIYEMPEDTIIEIDEPIDLLHLEALLNA